MFARPYQLAFTLIELMVTLAILAIIASIAVPAFHQYMAQKEAQNVSTQIQSLIRQTRHQAYGERKRLVACGTTNATSCGDRNSWTQGILVFVDHSKDRLYQTQEPLEAYIDLSLDYGSLVWRGFGVNHNILFNPDSGTLRGSNGSFSYCAEKNENSRKIILSAMGNMTVLSGQC